MAKIRIVGDSSGYVELAAPNAAGNNTLELPSSGTKLVGADTSNNLNVTGIVTATTVSVGSGTSISSPATNVFTLGTNNSERVRIDSSGNIGVGITNPQTLLQLRRTDGVYGTSYQPIFYIDNSSSGANITLNTGLGALGWKVDTLYDVANIEAVRENPSSGTFSALVFRTNSSNSSTGSGTERLRVTSGGLVGIATASPTSHLSVRGSIESLADSNDPNSSTEGGQLIVRAPINQAGTKYRFNIDNYYGTSGGQPSASPNLRIFREDDSTTANGTVLFNIDSNGRVVTPLQPRSNWQISANTTTYVRSVSIKRDTGNYVSSVPAGNGSTHGSVGRFTAPLNGTYLITIRGTGTTISGSNELLSVYGSWTSSTNVLNATNEVLDLRCTPLINDGIGWAATLYLNANDYWELDWYRPASTAYVGATVWDISTVLLG